MKLLLKQRIFSWTDSYDVYDENMKPKYCVKSALFSLGHQIHIYQHKTGTEIGVIKQRLLTFMPKFDIEIGGNTIGTISKQITLLRAKYDVDFNGWQIEGNLLGWEYEVYGAGQKVMHISKQPFNWGDTYVIDFNDPSDELMGLLLVLAIDAANCTNNS